MERLHPAPTKAREASLTKARNPAHHASRPERGAIPRRRLAAAGIAAVMLGAVATVHVANGFFMNWGGTQSGEGFEYHILALGLALPSPDLPFTSSRLTASSLARSPPGPVRRPRSLDACLLSGLQVTHISHVLALQFEGRATAR
jgi:hypothetical protein